MKEIVLISGTKTQVDDKDYIWLSQYSWQEFKHGNTSYAKRHTESGGKRKTVYMHRELMKPEIGEMVDHIDGNGLNNQRQNLRICTNSQNQFNSKKQSNNTSGFKGVSWHKGNRKWKVAMVVRGKRISIGYFSEKEKAAAAYDEFAIRHHKEFARLNIIN